MSASDPAVGAELTAPSPAVELREVTKRYVLFNRRRERALALFGMTGQLSHKTALDSISFSVQQGEAVGIIGANGSGKSTLLRLIAGASFPDSGDILVTGPVGAILELGLGFHPEFTGRENALVYGSLVGLPEPFMRERLPEILAFADLGDYADQPLRTYSSGMAGRLAFAVAAHVDPRVLVVDEVLAVGDMAFQKKCIDRIVEIKERGCTILFCSHTMYLVTSFCKRAIWLREGRIAADGPASDVADAYQQEMTAIATQRGGPSGSRQAAAAGVVRLLGVTVLNGSGEPCREVRPREPVTFVFTIEAVAEEVVCNLALGMDTADGRCVWSVATHADGTAPLVVRGRAEARLSLPGLPLAGGHLTVCGYLLDDSGLLVYDQATLEGGLLVRSDTWTPALVDIDHHWVVRD